MRFFAKMSLNVGPIRTTPDKLENATIAGHVGSVSEDNSNREITWLWWCRRFRKVLFPSTQKRKVGVFESLQFEERFGKAPFTWRISVDVRPNVEIRLRFQISIGIFRKTRRQRQRKCHRTEGFINNTMAVLVRQNSWYIFFAVLYKLTTWNDHFQGFGQLDPPRLIFRISIWNWTYS